MTLEAITPVIRYVYSGPGDYYFSFKAIADTDITVSHITAAGAVSVLVKDTDFTIVLETLPAIGGTVTAINPTTSGGFIQIERSVAATQPVNLENLGPLDMETLEGALDRMTMVIQQIKALVDGSVVQATFKGDWAASTSYTERDYVKAPDGNFYVCVYLHTSGSSFATDLAAGKWFLAVDVADIVDSGAEYMGVISPGNVKMYGAAGDGVYDDTAAFAAAMANNSVIVVPPGTYVLSSTLTLSNTGCKKIIGYGPSASVLKQSTANVPVITVPAGNWFEIAGLSLTRSVTATSGGAGIKQTGLIGYSRFYNLYIEGHYRGVELTSTGWSQLKDVDINKSVVVGAYFVNLPDSQTLQWSLDNVYVQLSGSHGFLAQADDSGSATQVTLGTWRNISTFGNSGSGVYFLGAATCPLQSVRLNGGFIGADGANEIVLDTHGSNHEIKNIYTEMAGRGLTGPAYTTPASGTGGGLTLTANNGTVMVTGFTANGHSDNGILSAATEAQFIGCKCTNNGLAAVSGSKCGLKTTAGYVMVNGGRYGNDTVGGTQDYSIYGNNGALLSVLGADLRNAGVAELTSVSAPTAISAFGNFPITVPTIVSGGGLIVGSGATGGDKGAGTINVGTNIFKNNTAYTNP